MQAHTCNHCTQTSSQTPTQVAESLAQQMAAGVRTADPIEERIEVNVTVSGFEPGQSINQLVGRLERRQAQEQAQQQTQDQFAERVERLQTHVQAQQQAQHQDHARAHEQNVAKAQELDHDLRREYARARVQEFIQQKPAEPEPQQPQQQPQQQTETQQPTPTFDMAKRIEEIRARRAEAVAEPVVQPQIPVDPIANKLAWQQEVFTRLRAPGDKTVNWLVADSIGKTNFAKHHCGDAITLRAPEHIWGYIKGVSDPILNQRGYKEDHLEGKAFVFDNNSADFDYNLLFDIKDGFISSEIQGPKQFTAPNVWVLSQREPRVWPETLGKIVLWKVVNGSLVEK